MKPLKEVEKEIEDYLNRVDYSEKIQKEYTIDILKVHYEHLYYKNRILEIELETAKKLNTICEQNH